MNPVELIRAKRDGEVLTREAIEWFVRSYVGGTIPDYQMSAFLMAVYFRGMTAEETTAFMDVMLRSGRIIDLSAIPGRKVDKHSTGGVGDKISLILAPMVAACGVPVPMISGRGLGHTGGTLDKLESIPGFRTALSLDEYRAVIAETGLVLAGQTEDIAPADRRMYALRDVTATIESVPLIAGSIMSKKLAEGIDALVLDVKTGNGAFMAREDQALELARTLVAIGTSEKKQTIAFVTDMSQPLGHAVGNWCEIVEAVECLRGKRVPDLMEVTLVLGGAMVMLGGKAGSIREGMQQCASAIWSGRAYERFLAVVRRQGGDTRILENPGSYPPPQFASRVVSKTDGYVAAFDNRRIGSLAVELGAGRFRVDDRVDPRAGMLFLRKRGEQVKAGEVLADVFTDREEKLERVTAELTSCIQLATTPPGPAPLIRALVDAHGIHPWDTPDIP